MTTSGSLIRAARQAAGLTQLQLADRLDVTPTLVSHWEADRKPVHDLPALAAALGVAAETLAGSPVPRAAAVRSPEALPLAQGGEPFINLSLARSIAAQMLGSKPNADAIYRWIHERGLPAYRNPLKLNRFKQPTLLFRRFQLVAWIEAQLARVNP